MDSDSPPNIMEIRVKEIMNLTSFWAQIGPADHLEAFDAHQKEMSKWCESRDRCKASSLLKPDHIVAVKQMDEAGLWCRARVVQIASNREIGLFFIDTGATEQVDVGRVCAEAPPTLCSISQQALQCSLGGVDMLEGEQWPDHTVAKFRELVTSLPTKVLVHQLQKNGGLILSIYAPYGGQYVSVGERLLQEGLIRYEPWSVSTLDLPVPPGYRNEAPSATKVESLSEDVTARVTEPTLKNAATSDGGHSSNNSSITITPDDTPNSAHCVNKVSPDDASSLEDNAETEVMSSSGGGGGVIQLLPQSHAVPSSGDKEVGHGIPGLPGDEVAAEKADQELALFGENPLDSVAQSVCPAAAASEVDKSVDLLVNHDSSSSSSLSDGDWDGDLLPRRSESSDVLVEQSPVKEVGSPEKEGEEDVKPVNTPEMMVAADVSTSKPKKTASFFERLSEDAGQTPHPITRSRPTFSYSRSLSGALQSAERSGDHWHGRGGGGGRRGRGNFRDNAISRVSGIDSDDRGKPKRRGRGRGYRDCRGSRGLQGSPHELSRSPTSPHKFSSPQLPHPMTPPLSIDEPPQPGIADVGASGNKFGPAGHSEKAQSPEKPSDYALQLSGMTQLEKEDELKWQVWKLEQEVAKVLKSHETDCVGTFGVEIKRILHGSGVSKLCQLPRAANPLELIMRYLMGEGINGNLNSDLLIQVLESIMEELDEEGACQAFHKTLADISDKMTEYGNKTENDKCEKFCQLLGALCSGISSFKYREAVFLSAKQCLSSWTKCVSLDTFKVEQQKMIQIQCFGYLLDSVDWTSPPWREVMKRSVEGPILDCILADEQPRYIRKAWSSKLLKMCFQERKELSTAVATTQKVKAAGDQGGESKDVAEVVTEKSRSMVKKNVPVMETSESQMAVIPYQQQKQQLPPHFQRMTSTPHGSNGNMVPEVFAYKVPDSGDVLVEHTDSYSHVVKMLETLHMAELIPKFKAAMIKDNVLDCDAQTIKDCLKDAGIPSGAIVGIMQFLDKLRSHPAGSGYFNQSSQCSTPTVAAAAAYYGSASPPAFGPMQMTSPFLMSPRLRGGGGGGGAHVTFEVPSSVVEGEVGVQPASVMTPYQVMSLQPLPSLSLVASEGGGGGGGSGGNSDVGSPATGQRVPGGVSLPGERSKTLDGPDDPSPKQWSTALPSTEKERSSSSSRPKLGFGKINCVLCGSKDHNTSDCKNRDKFFTHM